jgi:hypothetical protein
VTSPVPFDDETILLHRVNACSIRFCSGVLTIVNDDKFDNIGLIFKTFCCNDNSAGPIDRFCIFSDVRCSKARTCLKTRPVNSLLS